MSITHFCGVSSLSPTLEGTWTWLTWPSPQPKLFLLWATYNSTSMLPCVILEMVCFIFFHLLPRSSSPLVLLHLGLKKQNTYWHICLLCYIIPQEHKLNFLKRHCENLCHKPHPHPPKNRFQNPPIHRPAGEKVPCQTWKIGCDVEWWVSSWPFPFFFFGFPGASQNQGVSRVGPHPGNS